MVSTHLKKPRDLKHVFPVLVFFFGDWRSKKKEQGIAHLQEEPLPDPAVSCNLFPTLRSSCSYILKFWDPQFTQIGIVRLYFFTTAKRCRPVTLISNSQVLSKCHQAKQDVSNIIYIISSHCGHVLSQHNDRQTNTHVACHITTAMFSWLHRLPSHANSTNG